MSWLRGSLPRASYLITLRILLTRMSLVLLSIILIPLLTSSSSSSVSRQYSHHQAKLTRFKLSFDRAATYVFPFMFFLFNAGYWTVYLVIMPNFIQYGIPEWFYQMVYQVYWSTWSTWDPSVTLPDYLLDSSWRSTRSPTWWSTLDNLIQYKIPEWLLCSSCEVPNSRKQDSALLRGFLNQTLSGQNG